MTRSAQIAGAPTKIPFVPRNDRPVYCSNCFQNHRH